MTILLPRDWLFALRAAGAGLFLCLAWCQDVEADSAPSPVGGADNAILPPDRVHDLFAGLDLSSDDFKLIREALSKNETKSAEHLLANYFRHRTRPQWKFSSQQTDKSTLFNKQVADDAVKGHVKGGQVPVWANFPDGKIDWLYNETYHQAGVARNIGWEGQLTRMDFWEDMAAAYRATGDETYARAWVRQMHSFLQQCPPPDFTPTSLSVPSPGVLVRPLLPGQPPTGWTPIDAGCRMVGSWPDAFYSFVNSPSVSDDDLLTFVYGFLLHGQWMSTHHGPGNGWMIERTGLYTLASIFPEFKQATQWRNDAAKGQMEQETAQFLPDGTEDELTTGYQNVAIEAIMGIPKVAQIVGRLDELPPHYIDAMGKAYEFDLYMTAPDRQLPRFGDSWPVHVQGMIHDALPFFPNRQDFLWMASDGKAGSPPAQTSYAFDYAGFYVMRSGWDYKANYLVFRDGPFVFSHGHQDKLNLVMWVYGREILFNSGGGPYDGSKWRQYSIDTFSKNTVLVDGLPQRRPRGRASPHLPRIDSRWESTPDHDFVTGVYNDAYGYKGLHPATHVRRVLFLKPDLAIISDTLTPNDTASHTYQARWNLLTTKTQLNPTTHEVVTTDNNVPNLDIVPLNPDGLEVRTGSGQTEPELLGWNVLHDTVKQPAAATTVLQARQGTGVQTFLTLLVPIPAGTPSPVKGISATNSTTTEVTFNDRRKLAINVDPDPTGGMEATETLPSGKTGRHTKVNASHH